MTQLLTTIGASFTTLLGVLAGSILSSRSQRHQWARNRQAEACAAVIRESFNVLSELRQLKNRKIDPAMEGTRVPTSIDWGPWNEALTMLSLVADQVIVEAAHAIDAETWHVHLQVNRGWASDDWFKLRNRIEAKQRDFLNVARRRLAADGKPVRRLTGRPSDDDPIWDFRRAYFSSPDRPEQASIPGESGG